MGLGVRELREGKEPRAACGLARVYGMGVFMCLHVSGCVAARVCGCARGCVCLYVGVCVCVCV